MKTLLAPLLAPLPALLLLLAPAVALAVPIPLLDFDAAGFVGQAERGPLGEAVLVTSFEDFADRFGLGNEGLANPYLAPAAAGFFANGGARLWVVRTATADPEDLVGTGLAALAGVDEVAAVAIPGATDLAVQEALIAHAETAGDRMAILDPATLDDLEAIQAQRAALESAAGHAALYFPWLEVAPFGTALLVPPSGWVAGVYARTDPPDAPIGELAQVIGLSYAITQEEQELLNPLGINAIREFRAGDFRVWGARTVSSDPEWRYVPVRRIALNLRESLHAGTHWAVFEPNDENLWAQLRADVGDFLHARWQEGWFQGATADDAYFVRCDLTTMTPADLEAGRTVILVGFAPLRPAEFLILRIVHERAVLGVDPDVPGAPPVLLGAAPNPFNPRTGIAFELPRPAVVSLRIHDLAGRLVRTLAAGESLPAGRHERAWDGRDARGHGLSSGVYLIELRAGGATVSRRMTLVR
jgi:hypothetical protein